MTNEVNNKTFIWKDKFKLNVLKADAYGPPYINPILRLLIYLYIILVSGNFFMGWTGFQELLYKAGSFEDLCDPSTLEYISIHESTIIDCPDRKAAINNLYSIAFATNILFCIFSGLILDFFGQKLTFMIGHFTNFICWILIGLFPKNGILLKVIMVIIGLTSESLYIPLTTVVLYFPDNKSTILSILGSFRTLSFFISTLLSFIYLKPSVKKESFRTVAIVFAFVVYFCCFLIGSIIIQRNIFEKSQNEESRKIKDEVKKSRTISELCSRSLNLLSKEYKKPKFLQTILFTISASLHMGSVEFLNKSQREIFVTTRGESALNVFRYTQICSFIPGLFIGMGVDKFGTPECMITLQICMFMSYATVGFDKYIFKVLSCVIYLVGGSLYLTIIYCYVYENFPPERLGVVLGLILIVCGSLIFLNIPIYKYGLRLSKTSRFSNISWILVGLTALSILSTTGVIYIKRRINGHNCRKVNENKI